MSFLPGYIRLHETGELARRAQKLYDLMDPCVLCPRECRSARNAGRTGICNAGDKIAVSSVFAHFGEEPPITGTFGSGTVFLAHCNLRCVYCQNYDISHEGLGQEVTPAELANAMHYLARQGCHNVNFVTPTHFAPQIVDAVNIAAQKGFELPIVWNCGGYESLKVLELLDGVVDIYMPDMKYSGTHEANKYSKAPDYFMHSRAAIAEMHRQVGDLALDRRGIAYRGLLVRHLVMPNNVAGSEEVLRFIASLSKNTYVNIMDQYRPMFRAGEFGDISRRISPAEYGAVMEFARGLGLNREYIPK